MLRSFILASLDFRLVYKVQNAVKDLYEVIHVSPADLFETTDLVVVSISETGLPFIPDKLLYLDGKLPIERIRSSVIENMAKSKNKLCVIGVDPGDAIGASIIFCESVFATTVIYSIPNLKIWIRENLRHLNFDKLIIRVGNGGGKRKTKIIENLKMSFDTSIEEVNEANTSIREVNQITIHEQAAIKIANREGTLV